MKHLGLKTSRVITIFNARRIGDMALLSLLSLRKLKPTRRPKFQKALIFCLTSCTKPKRLD